jgi:integrase
MSRSAKPQSCDFSHHGGLEVARRGPGEGSIYRTADGCWHGSLSLGRNTDGRRLRRHVQARTQREVSRKLAQLRRLSAPDTTVGGWTRTWLALVERELKPATVRTYRTHIGYLSPLAGVALDRVKPEQLEAIYAQLARRGFRASTIQGVHRTFRACLAEAVRRGRLQRNPALVARPGRADHSEVDPLSLEQARAIMRAAAARRNGVRWELALILGLRQGEALGLQWDDVDFEASTLRVRRALQRAAWRHGCADRHRCGREARACPRRYGGGLVVVAPKSAASCRTMVLPGPLRLALEEHRRVQESERVAAGERWRSPPERGPMNSGSGWVFATNRGRPVDPRRDWRAWKELLSDAGVRDARLHDARHSAATFLLLAGVDTRTVMAILGWSQPMMVLRYQHVVDRLRYDAARRLECYFWGKDR